MGPRWRRGRRGQALIELAIASPLLIVLLAGGAQFGSLAFGEITMDQAASDGARTAIENPVSSLGSFFTSGGPSSMTCQGASSYSNPVCQAVLDSPGNYGLLSFGASRFVIRVTANQPANGPWSAVPLNDAVLASACGGTEVKGSVTLPGGGNASGATVQASGSGVTGTSTSTNGGGGYTLCLGVPSAEQVTISASFNVGGCTETAQVTQSLPTSGTVSGVNIALATCTTSTTTTTTTTTTTGGTTTESVTSTSVSAAPFTCTPTESALDGTYVTVKVSYPMPIFIPFIGGIFADSGNSGVRTVSSEVTMRVEPCTLTQGN